MKREEYESALILLYWQAVDACNTRLAFEILQAGLAAGLDSMIREES